MQHIQRINQLMEALPIIQGGIAALTEQLAEVKASIEDLDARVVKAEKKARRPKEIVKDAVAKVTEALPPMPDIAKPNPQPDAG
jgi:hypothetical protein